MKILKHLGYSIDYSHRGVGPYGPEATSQLPTSDKWLYGEGHVFSVIDPVYLSEA